MFGFFTSFRAEIKYGSLGLLFSLSLMLNNAFATEVLPFKNKLLSDYENFYTVERFKRIGIAGIAMGVVANTSVDKEIYNWYHDDVRSSDSDDFSKVMKFAGEGKYLIPISVLASHALNFDAESSIGQWGSEVARAYTVGLPFIWTSQYLTGASRPSDNDGSDWRPLEDNNGVSGHAFIGAVPFLVIAKNTENQYLKYLSYFASGLTAWSRVNDEAHYASQSVLGWYIAYEALDAVNKTNSASTGVISYAFSPILVQGGIGLGFNMVW
jgi:membrane-associated phospholipid phosphatase